MFELRTRREIGLGAVGHHSLDVMVGIEDSLEWPDRRGPRVELGGELFLTRDPAPTTELFPSLGYWSRGVMDDVTTPLLIKAFESGEVPLSQRLSLELQKSSGQVWVCP